MSASPQTMRVAINGRFLSQPITGMQRFGHEVVGALDRLITRGAIRPSHPVTIYSPARVRHRPCYSSIRLVTKGRLSGHAWEQIELPSLSSGSFLLNLCQAAPVAKLSQLVVMHDAAIYAFPGAFSWRFRAWYRVLMPTLGRLSKQLVTVSQFSRQELTRYCGIPSKRLPVVYESGEHILSQPADNTILQRHGLQPGGFVLAVSSLNANKNFQSLVRAFEVLAHPEFEMVVAGGTDPRVFRSSRLPLGSVKYIGYVSDAELRALYEAAGCFAFPSFYEGFGLPPVEAMCCGCPVVASGTASMPEVCGQAALYCNPQSPEDIAEKLTMVMSDRRFQATLRERGLQQASRYGWETCAAELWELAANAMVAIGQERVETGR